VFQAKRAAALVEGQKLEAAHAEKRADLMEFQHLGKRPPALHRPHSFDAAVFVSVMCCPLL